MPTPTCRPSPVVRAAIGLLAAALAATLPVTGDGPRREGGRVHEVLIADNLFSPQRLVIAVGDTVRWTNLTGIHHNVASCTVDQMGCSGASATESFASKTDTFWVYDYTFTVPGSNPYVCQPHARFMTGVIEVLPLGGTPPVVPDGTGGDPLLVSKLVPDGSALSIAFDTERCGAVDYQILAGRGSELPATLGGSYVLSETACAIGARPPFIWTGVPDPATDPSRFLWWVVVATDALTTEGSWGEDSNGAERNGQGRQGCSGACGIAAKSLDNRCGQ